MTNSKQNFQSLIVLAIIAIGIFFIFSKNNNKTIQKESDQKKNNEELIVSAQDTQNSKSDKISIPEMKKILEDKTQSEAYTIIDIRTKESFFEGHIDKAINIDLSANYTDEVEQLDKNNSYIIYCERGITSEKALEMFKSMGFKNIFDLEGGYRA